MNENRSRCEVRRTTAIGRQGFTLIEMLVSVALSVIILSAAYTAVRVGSQAVTSANHMALQNQLFRAGLTAAIEDLDFFTTYDDPIDPTRQPLRSSTVPFGSNPFRPLQFDPDFNAAKAKTWWRGAPVYLPTTNAFSFGDYSLYSKCGYVSTPVADAVMDPIRRWLPENFKRINDTLGHYGLIDYLPVSSIFQYFDSSGTVPNEFWDVSDLTDPTINPRSYLAVGGQGQCTRDSDGFTWCTIFGLTTNSNYLAMGFNRAAFSDYYLDFVGNVDPKWRSVQFHAQCPGVWTLLASRPEHWPKVDMISRRMYYCSRWINLMGVSMKDPISGVASKLQFTATGSTLRGARQQRGLDTYLVSP